LCVAGDTCWRAGALYAAVVVLSGAAFGGVPAPEWFLAWLP